MSQIARLALFAAILLMLWEPVAAAQLTLPMGTEVKLVTAQPLSSKNNVKGDLVALSVGEDVRLGGEIVIPKGTPAVGQIIDARAKGAMGMNGRLVLRPLYLQTNGTTVRLTGADREKGTVAAGAVIGMVVLGSAGFTGRSASIPVGSPVAAMVERRAIIAH